MNERASEVAPPRHALRSLRSTTSIVRLRTRRFATKAASALTRINVAVVASVHAFFESSTSFSSGSRPGECFMGGSGIGS